MQEVYLVTHFAKTYEPPNLRGIMAEYNVKVSLWKRAIKRRRECLEYNQEVVRYNAALIESVHMDLLHIIGMFDKQHKSVNRL